jgi:hypothetical protein
MANLSVESENIFSNPLDMIEQVIIDRDLPYDRPNDDDIIAEITASWCNYKVWFSWDSTHGALSFSCYFDSKLPIAIKPKIYPLLAMINEKLWLGHFGLVSDDCNISFRHTILMRSGCVLSVEQLEDLIDIAVTESERFFPAFQSVIWGNKQAHEALEMSLFETIGEA